MPNLEIFADPASAGKWCKQHRQLGHSIGFVPTMGALHEGHLSLIARSVSENDRTCASIFVNPLQFDDPQDFARYPQNLSSDYNKLSEYDCDMVFLGSVSDYFRGETNLGNIPLLDPGPFGQGLEGDYRPGHLEGVCTIVNQLFKFIGNCNAYFGLKDYQQLRVIQDLANRMGYPNIVPCRTVRDKDGLALSSRNHLLGPEERQTALRIYQSLAHAKDAWQTGERYPENLKHTMIETLDCPEIKIDYAEVRDPENWTAHTPAKLLSQAIGLIAVYIGTTRLIDNLRLDCE